MARQSAEALALVLEPGQRLAVPADLNEAEAVVWRQTVDSKPPEWFGLDSVPVLKEYARASVTCDRLAAKVNNAMNQDDSARLERIAGVRDRESKRVASLATKLRLTQQSRYTPSAAATGNRKAAGRRPWES